MKTIRYFQISIISISILVIALWGCQHDEVVPDDLPGEAPIPAVNDAPEIVTRNAQPLILGQQKENPFSVENMRIALDTLRAYANESSGISLKSVEEIEITPTDLYVRFLAKDSLQNAALMNDTTLTLFDFPLDYEIRQNGDYYHDPQLADIYTWQYTTVKPGYVPHENLEYQILAELFIPENSEYYTEEIIDEQQTSTKSHSENYNDVLKALLSASFVITGNGHELAQYDDEESTLKSSTTTCVKKCIWKLCWSSCDTYYYPEGFVRVNTPNGDVGVKGINIRLWRWFSYVDAWTNSQGYFKSSTRFDNILIGNSVDYEVIFKGKNRGIYWYMEKSLFGGLCLWANRWDAGYHSPNGYSWTFYSSSDYWGKIVTHNAMYDYMDFAVADGVNLPPASLDIVNKKVDSIPSMVGSAPLLKNHLNFSLINANNYWGAAAQLCGFVYFYGGYPDLILSYTKNLSDYSAIISQTWHELTHASMVRRLTLEKNVFWVSDYWSQLVCQEATNDNNTGRPYGHRGDASWAQIALTEGWAYYREWDMARRYLGWNSIYSKNWSENSLDPTVYSIEDRYFPKYFTEMFFQLRNIGCSFTNMEKSLGTYNIAGFRDNLSAKHPALRTQITDIVAAYE